MAHAPRVRDIARMRADALALAIDIPLARAERWAPHIAAAIDRWRIQRVPQFIAQCAHETLRLRRVEEILHYESPELLVRIWPRRFRLPRAGEHPGLDRLADGKRNALAYVRAPEKLAEYVYGGRMGNGPEGSGDGWNYRGRGLKSLTGRGNYSSYQAAAGVQCVARPELLATDDHIAADSAGWFWSVHQLDALTDVRAITRVVNGGDIGLDDRLALTQRAQKYLG